MSEKIKISDKAREQIKALMVPIVHESADKIAKACNDESSWGFYVAKKTPGGAAVVALTHEAAKDNARAQRILRCLKAGEV